jgi:hypothetical protein|tara:strand:- start:10506 stop:10640 length:135 start_codon:yes stop_codon:yes gene_type:complete
VAWGKIATSRRFLNRRRAPVVFPKLGERPGEVSGVVIANQIINH